MDVQNIDKILKIYGLLADEKSRDVFRTRFDFLLSHDEMKLFDWVLKENNEISCPELDMYEKQGRTDYILFGTGKEGKKAKKILEASNRKIIAWCDNNHMLWGTFIEGIQVISPGELLDDYRGVTVIISIKDQLLSVYQQLLMMEFPRERIFIPKNGFLLGFVGNQYFDMFQPKDGEVLVDAGCWDGETSKEFVKWCKGNYEHIYAFEPDAVCWQRCENTFLKQEIKEISFIKKGIWKEATTLNFDGDGRGSSRLCADSTLPYKVPVTSIDEVLGGKKVTFIKLDVEGSEMEALIGARKSIKKYKPRMAICVYHKPDDLWTLADYIDNLNLGYKLYLRHYTTCHYETVLYAV